jgi:hypothetical protein
MTKLENQNVTYSDSNNSITIGDGTTLTASNSSFGYYQEIWYPYYQPYYISYPVYITEKDKFEKAFNIAKLLLKKKLLISRKLKDFIALIEEIAKEL